MRSGGLWTSQTCVRFSMDLWRGPGWEQCAMLRGLRKWNEWNAISTACIWSLVLIPSNSILLLNTYIVVLHISPSLLLVSVSCRFQTIQGVMWEDWEEFWRPSRSRNLWLTTSPLEMFIDLDPGGTSTKIIKGCLIKTSMRRLLLSCLGWDLGAKVGRIMMMTSTITFSPRRLRLRSCFSSSYMPCFEYSLICWASGLLECWS